MTGSGAYATRVRPTPAFGGRRSTYYEYMSHPSGALRAIATALAIAFTLAGCSTGSTVADHRSISITVGSQAGFVNQVVAQAYGQALTEAGYVVDYNPGIGNRAAGLAGLESGIIDVMPDYAGLLLESVNATSSATDTETIMAALPSSLEPLGLTVLEPSTAQNSRVFVIRSDFATLHSLVSLADLAPIAKALTFGSTEPLESSSYGRRPLEFNYDVTGWRFRPAADDAAVIADLLDNSIQVADLSTIDPAIDENDFVVLKDPAHVIVAQNLVPVVRESIAKPDLTAILNTVSKKLVSADLSSFSADTQRLPSSVARTWLLDEGVIAEVP